MTLTTLVLSITLAAIALTAAEKLALNRVKNWAVSFLQNFCGALFVFSGFVKAIDPLGTAYKMEQYFAEFESTFAGTKAAFLAPLFPWLSQYADTFSVVMIVFEIVLGVMLLIGAARRFTAWAFLLLVGFFTFLTGFTYLTGYVPEGVNFFQFGQWGAYEATNMKVTDCGCFGDFLKLEPRISFMKDVFLLIPALVFVIRPDLLHELFTARSRGIIAGVATVGMLVYSLSNFVWNLPDVDFRPFREGVNIAERKALEEEAENNVEVIAYHMTNKSTGEVVELPFDEYMQRYQEFPAEEWELEQIKTEPTVARTKISDFEVSDLEGNEMTDELLNATGPSFMIVAYKLYGEQGSTVSTVMDSIFTADTIVTNAGKQAVPRLVKVEQKEVTTPRYDWDEDYLEKWREHMLPVAQAAKEAGHRVYVLTAYSDPARIKSFQEALATDVDFYQADDILLKTIIRSNPGLVLLKDGVVMEKWHYRQLPEYQDLQAKLAGN